MKRVFFATMVILCLSCDNENQGIKKCSKVKVLESVCGSVVLQILDPALVSFGQVWSDRSGQQYSGCFFTNLDCETIDKFGSQFTNGQELLVAFSETSSIDGCGRCAAIAYNPPSLTFGIKVISDCSQIAAELAAIE